MSHLSSLDFEPIVQSLSANDGARLMPTAQRRPKAIEHEILSHFAV